MSQQNDTGFLALEAASALEAYRLVQLDANGKAEYCGLTSTRCIGITLNTVAAGANVPIKRLNAPGTVKFTAADAIAINAPLYFAASGKVTDNIAAGGLQVAVSMETASADGSVFEGYSEGVLPFKGATYTTDATDNTNNYAEITTGFGANPSQFDYLLLTSAGVNREAAGASTITYPSAGVVRVANANMAASDTIRWTARP